MCLICRELRNPCTLVQVTEDYLRPFFLPLRIPTGKKHPKIKLQCLRKIRILTFGSLVHEINSFQEVLKLEHIFKKNYVVTGKTPHWFLTDRAVLNGNGVFSILAVSTKIRYPSFLKKFSFSRKLVSKLKH